MEGPLPAEGRCQPPARLWGVSCQKGSIAASSLPHLPIFLLHFVSVPDKGRSTPQTVTQSSCRQLPAPSESQDGAGKAWSQLWDIPGSSDTADEGSGRHRRGCLPLTGPCSAFWRDTNRGYRRLVLPAKRQLALGTGPHSSP